MNGMDKIKERILADARQEADKIISDAKSKANEIKNESEVKFAAVKERLVKEYGVKESDIRRRMISVAQLDMRKKVLETKQGMIDKAFAQCLNSIEVMPAQEYRAMIEELLLQIIQTGEEEVIFSHLDDARLGSDFITGINGKLTTMGRKGTIKISQEKGSFHSGFTLKAGGVEINNSFESILRVVREEIEPQIAKMLFMEV